MNIIQDKILISHPENKGAFSVPIILRSKTTVSVATGQTESTYQLVTFTTMCNVHIETESCFLDF